MPIGRCDAQSGPSPVDCAPVAIELQHHGPVTQYGGDLSTFGVYFMGLCVVGCATMGVVAARRGDFDGHRIWMFRYAGSMWGSFWLFRVMELVLGPLLRDVDTASILLCIWGSAPLGIAIAEVIRRRPVASSESAAAPAVEG